MVYRAYPVASTDHNIWGQGVISSSSGVQLLQLPAIASLSSPSIARREPDRERESGPVEHRSGRRRGVMPAGAADPDAAGGQLPGVAPAALWATKSVGPPRLDQVVEAGVIVVKSTVKRAEGARIVA